MTFRLKFCVASLLALAMFSGVAGAQDATQPPAAQEQPVVPDQQAQQPAALPDEVLALLNDKRAAGELSEADLRARLKAARKALKMEGLPDDAKGQIQALADADKAEIENRRAAAEQQQPAPSEKPKEQPPAAAAEQAPVPEQPVQAAQPAQEQPVQAAQPAPLPDSVLGLLNDKRASSELSDEDLRQRIKAVRKAMKMDGVPDDAKATLQALHDSDKAEIDNRKAAAEQQAKPVEAPKAEQPAAAETQPVAPVVEPPKQAAAPAPAVLPADVMGLLADTRTVDALSNEELVARMRSARKASKDEALPADVRDKLQAMATEARAALATREAQNTPPAKQPEPAPAPVPAAPQVAAPAEPAPPIVTKEPVGTAAAVAPPAPEPKQTDRAQVQTLDGNTGDPVAEQKAKVFLSDATPATSLTDEALRTRLDGIRDLLAENELSAATERALRLKLKNEREVLRARLAVIKAQEEAKAQAEAEANWKRTHTDNGQQAAAQPAPRPGQPPQPAADNRRKPRFDFNIIITAGTPQREILRDRRPSDELAPEELRRRIQTYRDVQSDQRYLDYDPGVRDYWRQTMVQDRQVLRRRLLDERAVRADSYRQQQTRVNLNDLAFGGDEPQQDVFAAEVDDQQIEDVIVAPPRRKVQKRYAVKDFATNRQLRESVARVEVDTIHFGFNEAFVREEEVDNLDQVASVMEKVLRKYPREVFLIEGHTDAVGSDAYNIKLSKARAEAVKKTLLTYYLIPAKNLQTVGLGERYLKIPTADPEPENRRVSISRVTAFVGQAPQ